MHQGNILHTLISQLVYGYLPGELAPDPAVHVLHRPFCHETYTSQNHVAICSASRRSVWPANSLPSSKVMDWRKRGSSSRKMPMITFAVSPARLDFSLPMMDAVRYFRDWSQALHCVPAGSIVVSAVGARPSALWR